jgi:hypothetical protein
LSLREPVAAKALKRKPVSHDDAELMKLPAVL